MIRVIATVSVVVFSMFVTSQATSEDKTPDKTIEAQAPSPEVTVNLQAVIIIREATQAKTYLCLLPKDVGVTARMYYGYGRPAVILKRDRGFEANGIWSSEITLIATAHTKKDPFWVAIIVSPGRSVTMARDWKLNRQDSIERIYRRYAVDQHPPKTAKAD